MRAHPKEITLYSTVEKVSDPRSSSQYTGIFPGQLANRARGSKANIKLRNHPIGFKRHKTSGSEAIFNSIRFQDLDSNGRVGLETVKFVDIFIPFRIFVLTI